MNKLKFIVTIFIVAFQTVSAQTKLLTMEDVVLNSKTTLAPAKLNQLKWIKGTNFYSFVDTSHGERLMKGTISKNPPVVILTFTELKSGLKKINADTLAHFPEVQWINTHVIRFENGNKIFDFDISSKSAVMHLEIKLDVGAEHPDTNGTTEAIANTIDNNVFIFKNGKTIRVTNDTEKNIVNGHSVHREEFGISKGTFWSPKGNYLAFYRMDQTMVTDYPILDLKERPAKANNIKYPMAGDKSHEVTVGIYDMAAGKTIFLKTGEPKDQYLTNIAWSPDEKSIYMAVLNRDQNHLRFNQYNPVTGDFVKTLFEEKDDKYVQPLHPAVFVPAYPDQFVWQSRRDGFNHLYLYDTAGNMVRQLTKGNWEVTDFAGFDPKGMYAFFTSDPGWVNRCFNKVSLKDGEIKTLTPEYGTHTATLNESCDFFFDDYSSLETAGRTSIVSAEGNEIKELINAGNPLKDYKLGGMSIFKLKSSAGDDLFCELVKPIDFDSTRKYPVIIYVYGGPNVQLINNTWLGGGGIWSQYMAERGFVLFTVDGRGSANRGKSFEQVIFRNLGKIEMEDQLTGVNFLRSLPFTDPRRMGIYGWSYGGFMTISMITNYLGVFKAAVAGGPVIDWKYYEVMYTERYMDTPLANPEGYERSNLLNYVKNLNCKLLLIHGTSDDVVVWQHSLMYLKKAVDENKQLDYFVYPGHPHNVRGKDRIHLLTKISNYFIDNL